MVFEKGGAVMVIGGFFKQASSPALIHSSALLLG